jgi:transposase
MEPLAPSEAAEALITLGVDVTLDRPCRRLGSKSAPTTKARDAELVAWAEGFGALDCVGVEGSFGKHGTADAKVAARAVQANVATGEPKAADGIVEMMRALRVACRSAVKARTQRRPTTCGRCYSRLQRRSGRSYASSRPTGW